MEKRCLICGNSSRFKFYNVQSCESCKQFFRRIVVKHNEYHCDSIGKCDYLKGEKCRGCRLDKCLRVGMDPLLVTAEKTKHLALFLNKLQERCRRLYEQNLASNDEDNYRIEGGQFGWVDRTGSKEMGIDSSLAAPHPAQHVKPVTENPGESVDNGDEEMNMAHIFKKKYALSDSASNSNPTSNIFSRQNREANQLQYFCHLLKAQRRIMDGLGELPHSFVDKCQNIEDVLCGPENILGLHESFPAYPKIFSAIELDKYYEEVHTIDSLDGVGRLHGLFKLIQVGLFKVMIPAFNAVAFEDKVLLIRELGHQITSFTNAYYSARRGARVMASQNGVTSIDVVKAKYKDDRRLISLAQKVFVNSIDALYRVHPLVEEEEFALLLAILCSNPAVSGLSEHAKELLYEEQVKYSRLLMQYNQLQLGGGKGAQRYAECVQLIDSAFQAAKNYELMSTYIEVFLQGNDYHAGIYPQCLKAITR